MSDTLRQQFAQEFSQETMEKVRDAFLAALALTARDIGRPQLFLELLATLHERGL